MSERLTFSRASGDDGLKHLAATLKAKHGLLARVPQTLHLHAAALLSDEAKALAFSSGRPLLECHHYVRTLHPHLVFLCAAQISPDSKADVAIEEDAT